MHFGASRKQVSLHTCHASLKDASGQMYTRCFCTMSENTKHTPTSVWAHLDPVLKELQTIGVGRVHFVSDGPTSQYRNRTNFHLHHFKQLWNFLVASHGKGPADGIGAAVKCTADRMVTNWKDILDVDSLKNAVNVKIHGIQKEDIDQERGEKSLRTIKGTMQIHQLISNGYGKLSHRKLSCYCCHNESTHYCNCHALTEVESVNKYESVPPTSVVSLEKQLTAEQVIKFKKRLAEGYDVEMLNLSTLDEVERKEYLYWKSWRSIMLGAEKNNAETMDSSSDDEYRIKAKTVIEKEECYDDTVSNTSSDPDWEPVNASNKLRRPNEKQPKQQLESDE